MLQHFGARQRTVLGDMPHQDKHSTCLFGEARQVGGTFTYLSHTTRGRG